MARRAESAQGPRRATKQNIARYFRPLIGKVCWGVNYERQLNLSMNFGAPSLHIREPRISKSKLRVVREAFARRLVTVRGDWWLWVYLARWKLSVRTAPSISDSTPIRQMKRALDELSGQQLKSVSTDTKTGATTFTFDLGAKLAITPQLRRRSELYLLYRPAAHTLVVWNEGTFELSE
jgi:hypothetical protein